MNAAWASLRRIPILPPPSMSLLGGARGAAVVVAPPPLALPPPVLLPGRPAAPPWRELWGSAALLLYLAAAYFAVLEVFPRQLSGEQALYLAQPLVWSGLALLSYALWRTLPERPPMRPTVVGLAALAAAFQLSFFVLAGLLYGFGHSPYLGGAATLAKNGLYLATLLAGLELARGYLMQSWGRSHMAIAFASVAVLFAAVNIPPAQFDLGGDREVAFETIGTSYLPAIAESVVATLLVSIGGPIASFTYGLGLAAFEWYSPILPNLEWTVRSFVTTLAPALVLLVVRDVYLSWTTEEETESAEGDLSAWWLVAGVLVVAAIWLNTGMLGVKPALVSGPSMEPALDPLDLVFTKEVDPESLRVGDIIRYEQDGVPIVHRIVEIPRETAAGFVTNDGPLLLPKGASGPVFITKGDANNTKDPPVLAEQIEGKVVFVVPKVGWLPNQVKRLIDKIV